MGDSQGTDTATSGPAFKVTVMRTKSIVAASVIAASVTTGAIGGALLFAPQLSGADETTATAQTDDGTTPAAVGHHRKLGGPFGAGLDVAAEAIGISEEDLRAALEDGKTIAQVAEELDVDVQTVIDALVAAATERLEELEASLPERISELVNNPMPAFGEGHPVRGPGGPGFGPMLGAGLDAAAEALGIEVSELHDALRDGKSIADVAAENDVDVQDVIDALVAAGTEAIDDAVAAGKIDEERAAELKDNLSDRVTAFVNGEHPVGPGPGPRFHHFGEGGADGDADETEGAVFTS